MGVGLNDEKKGLFGCEGRGLSIADVLDKSKLISELFSLLLLLEPSVSLLRLMGSVVSLPFSAMICTIGLTHQRK